MAEDIPYDHKGLVVAIAMNHDYLHRCEMGMEHVRRTRPGMEPGKAYRTIKQWKNSRL